MLTAVAFVGGFALLMLGVDVVARAVLDRDVEDFAASLADEAVR